MYPVAASSSEDLLRMAQKHLVKVQEAWSEPDWSDLALYGFYALEAAVMAASAHFGWAVPHNHPAKVAAARRLHNQHRLPDVADLLTDLNTARKAESYGDVERPEDLEAEDVASEIEKYVEQVAG